MEDIKPFIIGKVKEQRQGVIKDLVNKFGGIIDEDDCDDEGYYYVSQVKDKSNY